MTENEFEKRFMAEMSEQQNTAVKAVQGGGFTACRTRQRKDDRAYNEAWIYDKLLWHQPL